MNYRNAAILWAQSILKQPDNYYILDTETTGLADPEILELGVIDLAGNEIIDRRFCPESRISPQATAIHGLTKPILEDEPSFSDVIGYLEDFIFDREILIYNFNFDHTAICHSYDLQGVAIPSFSGECVMHQYSQFCGEWNDYRGSYKCQKLPGGDHSAIGDCHATLEVIKAMAASPLSVKLTADEVSKYLTKNQ